VSFTLSGVNASRWSMAKLRSSLSGSYSISTWDQQRYRLYNKTTKHMISSHDVVFRENIFKVSNKHITIAILSYVRSDTVFMDNSTSTQPDDIEDNLANWTSPSEWKFTTTSVKKK
jgi:hypothetical protein